MGIIAEVLDRVAEWIDWFTGLLPTFSVDHTLLGTAINTLTPYFTIANIIFPIKETLAVLMILISFALCMVVFWALQRAINLLRGAG